MIIACISDTHMKESSVKIPECDILIHAGDTDVRTLEHLEQLNGWFYNQPAKYKIYVSGNHDFINEKLNRHSISDILNCCTYLCCNSVRINNLNIYGSPFSLRFFDWAFMQNEEDLARIYSKIPENTDIIISHSPPYGILDKNRYNNSCGSFALLERIKQIKPKLVIFGHIHESYGIYQDSTTTYVNASLMNENYRLKNKPIIIEI